VPPSFGVSTDRSYGTPVVPTGRWKSPSRHCWPSWSAYGTLWYDRLDQRTSAMTRCQMAHWRHQTIRLAAYSAGSRYAPAQQIVVHVPEIQRSCSNDSGQREVDRLVGLTADSLALRRNAAPMRGVIIGLDGRRARSARFYLRPMDVGPGRGRQCPGKVVDRPSRAGQAATDPSSCTHCCLRSHADDPEDQGKSCDRRLHRPEEAYRSTSASTASTS
jgi:hypothetical protein